MMEALTPVIVVIVLVKTMLTAQVLRKMAAANNPIRQAPGIHTTGELSEEEKDGTAAQFSLVPFWQFQSCFF